MDVSPTGVWWERDGDENFAYRIGIQTQRNASSIGNVLVLKTPLG
jgi:hypothetical protein